MSRNISSPNSLTSESWFLCPDIVTAEGDDESTTQNVNLAKIMDDQKSVLITISEQLGDCSSAISKLTDAITQLASNNSASGSKIKEEKIHGLKQIIPNDIDIDIIATQSKINTSPSQSNKPYEIPSLKELKFAHTDDFVTTSTQKGKFEEIPYKSEDEGNSSAFVPIIQIGKEDKKEEEKRNISKVVEASNNTEMSNEVCPQNNIKKIKHEVMPEPGIGSIISFDGKNIDKFFEIFEIETNKRRMGNTKKLEYVCRYLTPSIQEVASDLVENTDNWKDFKSQLAKKLRRRIKRKRRRDRVQSDEEEVLWSHIKNDELIKEKDYTTYFKVIKSYAKVTETKDMTRMARAIIEQVPTSYLLFLKYRVRRSQRGWLYDNEASCPSTKKFWDEFIRLSLNWAATNDKVNKSSDIINCDPEVNNQKFRNPYCTFCGKYEHYKNECKILKEHLTNKLAIINEDKDIVKPDETLLEQLYKKGGYLANLKNNTSKPTDNTGSGDVYPIFVPVVVPIIVPMFAPPFAPMFAPPFSPMFVPMNSANEKKNANEILDNVKNLNTIFEEEDHDDNDVGSLALLESKTCLEKDK